MINMERVSPSCCPWPNLLCMECNEINCADEVVQTKISTVPSVPSVPIRPKALSRLGVKLGAKKVVKKVVKSGAKKVVKKKPLGVKLGAKNKPLNKTIQRKVDKIKLDKTMTPAVRRSLLAELGVV